MHFHENQLTLTFEDFPATPGKYEIPPQSSVHAYLQRKHRAKCLPPDTHNAKPNRGGSNQVPFWGTARRMPRKDDRVLTTGRKHRAKCLPLTHTYTPAYKLNSFQFALARHPPGIFQAADRDRHRRHDHHRDALVPPGRRRRQHLADASSA